MENNYRIFIKRLQDPDGNAFFLPVNPESITEELGDDSQEYNVLALGPVIQPRMPKLKTVSFSSYFPGRPDTDMAALDPQGVRTPVFYIGVFENAMKNKEILTYIPSRRYETGEAYALETGSGMDCVVTGFSHEEKGAETGDFYFDLTLTEYKSFAPLKLTLTQTEEEGQESVIATQESQRTVPDGQLYVGCGVSVNGPFYYSSYGDEPHGQASGGVYRISRIVNDDPDRPYPIHIVTENGGALGWVKRGACQTVGDSL